MEHGEKKSETWMLGWRQADKDEDNKVRKVKEKIIETTDLEKKENFEVKKKKVAGGERSRSRTQECPREKNEKNTCCIIFLSGVGASTA